MYEIWSVGHKPFEDHTNDQVKICIIINWLNARKANCQITIKNTWLITFEIARDAYVGLNYNSQGQRLSRLLCQQILLSKLLARRK